MDGFWAASVSIVTHNVLFVSARDTGRWENRDCISNAQTSLCQGVTMLIINADTATLKGALQGEIM